MSQYSDAWAGLDTPPELTEKTQRYNFLNRHVDKLDLTPDEQYKMGWGADAHSEDWIKAKSDELLKTIQNSKSTEILKNGFKGEAAAAPAAAATASNGSGQATTKSSDGSRDIRDPNPEWTAKTDEEKAAWYSEHPNYAAVTQAGQGIFGMTKLGALQNKFFPEEVQRHKDIASGVNPNRGNGGFEFGNSYGTGFSGDSSLGMDGTAGEREAAVNAGSVNDAARAESERTSSADSARAAEAAAREGNSYDPHDRSDTPSYGGYGGWSGAHSDE